MALTLISPLVQHRFRLDFGGLETLNRQVQTCELFMVEKRLNVDIYENVDGDVLPLLIGIIHTDKPFMARLGVLPRTGNDPLRWVRLSGLVLNGHTLALSYISSEREVAVHRCVFSYSDIQS